MDNNELYLDIVNRTNGEIYIGVVGPVRTGKSTFIRNFINIMILPHIKDENEKNRLIDELPQGGVGKTVMTAEPKFIPKTGVEIKINEDNSAKFRLIDCVGYVVDNVNGIYEGDKERMVRTPWSDKEIPFSKAAEIGTNKVINEHSTLGIVITTDGSIGELTRESYLDAENKTINELKNIHKPFIVIVNTAFKQSEYAKNIAEEIHNKYGVFAIPVDVENLTEKDINNIFTGILQEFPVNQYNFYIPRWVETLPIDNPIKNEIINLAKEIINGNETADYASYSFVSDVKIHRINFVSGSVRVDIAVKDNLYYEYISDLTGVKITDDFELINILKQYANDNEEFDGYLTAAKNTKEKGYGVMLPKLEDTILEKPEITKNGNKYGVMIKAKSSSIHMIKVDISTEIAPIVGTKEQAEDLLNYINESEETGNLWDTNIFGKTIGELVWNGINSKLDQITDDCQTKLKDTMKKVVNESSNGIVCLII